MEIVLLIGITGALGGLALGFGVFVLDKPPPARLVAPRGCGSQQKGKRLRGDDRRARYKWRAIAPLWSALAARQNLHEENHP
jgi:hypothetical protein